MAGCVMPGLEKTSVSPRTVSRGDPEYQRAAAVAAWVVKNQVTAFDTSSFAIRSSAGYETAARVAYFTDGPPQPPPGIDDSGVVLIGAGVEMAIAHHPDFATARRLLRGYFA